MKKKNFIKIIGVCALVGILSIPGFSKPQKKVLKKEQGKVIYNFKTEDEMKIFVKAIQTKQAILTKIAVLQEYLLSEKARLDQINGQLMLKFRIDPSKNYNLDPKNKNIIEVKKTREK